MSTLSLRLGPINWVRGEIDIALSQCESAVNNYRDEKDEVQRASLAKEAFSRLQQIRGALAIVRLQGLAQFATVLGQGIARLETTSLSSEALQPLVDGIDLLRQHLDYIVKNGVALPFQSLRPTYEKLQQLLGVEKSNPADLFFPDLSRPLPEAQRFTMPEALLPAHLITQREHMQHALLKWMQSPEAFPQELLKAVAVVDQVKYEKEDQQALWWVAHGFMEAISQGAIGRDLNVLRLCGQLDRALHLLSQRPSRGADGFLIRDLAYYLCAPMPSPVATKVRDHFLLEQWQPRPTAAVVRTDSLFDLLERAGKEWGRLCADVAAALPKFQGCVAEIATTLKIDKPAYLARLTQTLTALTESLGKNPLQLNKTWAWEVAMLLTLIKVAGRPETDAAAMADHADEAAKRGESLLASTPLPARSSFLETVAQQGRQYILIPPIIGESLKLVIAIEEELDGFFRNPRGTPPTVDQQFATMDGQLELLDLQQARESLIVCRKEAAGLSTAAAQLDQAVRFKKLAVSIARLHFYLEDCQSGGDIAILQHPYTTEGDILAKLPLEPASDKKLPTAEDELEFKVPMLQELGADDPMPTHEVVISTDAPAADDPVSAPIDMSFLEPAAAKPTRDVAPPASAPAVDDSASSEIDMLFLESAAKPTHDVATSASAPAVDDSISSEIDMSFLESAAKPARDAATPASAPAVDDSASSEIDMLFLESAAKPTHDVATPASAPAVDDSISSEIDMSFLEPAAAKPTRDVAASVSALAAAGLASSAINTSLPESAAARPARDVATPASAPAAADLVSSAIDTPLPKSAVAKPAAVPPPSVDQEMLGVFLEEAADLLPNLQNSLKAIEQAPENREILTTVRRTFHTLKGSGRMVGLKDFGETAWAMEQVFNQWLAGDQPASSELLALTQRGHDLLTHWTDELRQQHYQSPDDAPTLRKQANDLRLKAKLVGPKVDMLEIDFNAMATKVPAEPVVPETESAEAIDLDDALFVAPPIAEEKEEAPTTPAIEDLGFDIEMPVPTHEPQGQDMASVEEDEEAPTNDDAPATPFAAIPPATSSIKQPDQLAEDPEVLAAFFSEGRLAVETMHSILSQWQQVADHEQLMQLIRVLHTLKGSARMSGALQLGEYLHRMETGLSAAMTQDQPGPEVRQKFAQSLELVSDSLTGLEHLQHKPQTSNKNLTNMAQPLALDSLINDAGEIGALRAQLEIQLKESHRSLRSTAESVAQLREQLREMEIRAETQMLVRKAQAEATHTEFDPLEMDRYTRLQELTRMMAERTNDISLGQQELVDNLAHIDNIINTQARLNRSLLQGLMKVRLVPFSTLSERLTRTVALAAKSVHKGVKFDILGEDIRVDPALLTKLAGPLEHLLRNAVAHGIEPRDERINLSKRSEGLVRLSVSQVLNEIHIEVSDDGRGLNLKAIESKARSLGFIKPNTQVSEQHLIELLYLPGFSTGTEVTETSGRGVGLDVVRSQVLQQGGQIQVTTSPGKGVTFHLRLPLTSAITQALLVKAAGRTWALPAFLLEKAQRFPYDEVRRIHLDGYLTAGNDTRYEYHRLADLLGGMEKPVEQQRQRVPMLMIRSGNQNLILEVEELLGSRDILLKSTGPQVGNVVGVSGATVMADGDIVLMINPLALTKSPAAIKDTVAVKKSMEEVPSVASVMVVDDSLTVRRITSRLLSRMGYRVLLAKDGVEALQMLEREIPKVMLVDIEMPHMDGFELLRQIRADNRWQSVPVVMITSRMGGKHRQYALSIGANHYLGKPYQEAALLDLVYRYAKPQNTTTSRQPVI